MDYSEHTPDELIDALIETLTRWDKHERYYLGTLIPRIGQGDDLRGSAIADIADEMRKRMNDDQLRRLPELVTARLPRPAPAAVVEPELRIKYPGMGEYSEALPYPSTCLLDPELKQGEVTTNPFGMPLVMSGNFALTYSVTVGWSRFAVRCFHRHSRALQTRYRAISEELDSLDSPYFLKFAFQPEGVRVGDEAFPIVKMEWGEGETLAQFLESRHGRAGNVHKLRNSLRSLARYLEDQPLAQIRYSAEGSRGLRLSKVHRISSGRATEGSRTHREKGREVTTPIPERQLCYTCDHFFGDVGNCELVCEAFPEGVPSDFLSGKSWHTRPVEGDRGILYTPAPECGTCAHYIGLDASHARVCEAFPEGIPDVLLGKYRHTRPVEGDRGILYTPARKCSTCAHFIGADGNHSMACEAFPEGISDDILLGLSLHTSPVEGDRGIQYTPVPSRAS